MGYGSFGKHLKKDMKNIFKKLFRQDSWVNHATNLGVSTSRTNNTVYIPNLVLSKRTLEGLYNDDGIAQRIVESVVADSLKGFINADVALLAEMKRIKAKQKIFEAGSFGRLYGGALLVAFIDDGQELSKPLNLERIHKVSSLQVFDRYQVRFEEEDICHDIYQEHFGEPEIYTIVKQQYGYMKGEELCFKVHASRCFLFGGQRLSSTATIRNKGWDGSILQACHNSIRNYAIINNSSVEIVQDFVQPIMKMSGLSDKASSGELDAVRRRLELIDRSRSSQNTIMLDSEGGEEYTKLPSTVSGLSELWEQFSETICATTGIPASRLFGRSPSGLNASGESDMKNWHDIVSTYREDQIEPCITWLTNIMQNQQNWQEKPTDFTWAFPLLDNPSEAELAEIRKKYAEIDAIYIDRGGISASGAWQERFGSGQFQRDIQLAKIEEVDEEEEIEH
jgi:phage-related protein (TIGR01555 family)